MTYFHSIFYGISIVKFPSYLSRFNGSNLRNCHLDNLSIQSSVHPKVPQNLKVDTPYTGITKSFFYRAHSAWNRLPFEIHKIESPTLFKKKTYWSSLERDVSISKSSLWSYWWTGWINKNVGLFRASIIQVQKNVQA